ncbi:MAG: pyruvate kinase [Gaiellales bacterium]|nr:MAG: pyruvate kinase [Gaiellales bacterium]
MAERRTKIIVTYGPAVEAESQLRRVIDAGANAFRLNFSHGTHNEYAQAIARIRAVAAESGVPLALIADLQGPKIRVGDMPAEGVELRKGKTVTLTSRRIKGDGETVPVSFPDLGGVLRQGKKVLLDDGRITLKVLEVQGGDANCRVMMGGLLESRRGVNFPGIDIKAPPISGKDRQDLDFALQAGVDYVALSFISSADDIGMLRSLVESRTERRVRIIAKIENQEAIRNITSIIATADAVMIARGDLGVEIPPERVPYWQKEIIRQCISSARPVITATQMLESMIEDPVPTRAEASDVANAIYDGSDAIMLSGETAIGRYPVRAVNTMHRIARTTEAALSRERTRPGASRASVSDAISHAACEIAESLGAQAILTPTSSGSTALQVSRQRASVPQVALSPEKDVVNQLAIAWGVMPFMINPARDTDDMFEKAIAVTRDNGIAQSGDEIVITAGVPVNVAGTTNLIKVHRLD